MEEKYLNIEINFKNFLELLESEIKKLSNNNENSDSGLNHYISDKNYFINIDYDRIGDEIKNYSKSVRKFHNYTTDGKNNKSTPAEHFFRGALCDKSV